MNYSELDEDITGSVQQGEQQKPGRAEDREQTSLGDHAGASAEPDGDTKQNKNGRSGRTDDEGQGSDTGNEPGEGMGNDFASDPDADDLH